MFYLSRKKKEKKKEEDPSHCCHSTPVAHAVWCAPTFCIHHRRTNFFIFLHTSAYFIVFCCWQTYSGVLNYTTRAVLIADLRPTNKQYSAQSRVPRWGRLGTVRCRASHLIVTGPRYHQLTGVTSTKGRVLTLHESFSSPGDSDTAYNETTILEPDSESEVCRLHSTVLDPVGSDDPDQSRQEMPIRHSLKEAPKDPAVVQVLTNATTSSLRGEILERKEEKTTELQDRGVDSLEQYSRRNNVFRSAYPWEHHRCREHRCHRPKGCWGDRHDDHWRDDWSVTPGLQAGQDGKRCPRQIYILPV